MSHRVSVGTGVVPMKVSEMSIGEYEAEDAKLKSMQMARYEEPNMNVISATTMNLGEESPKCAFYHAAGFCDRHQTAMRQFMDTECQATCNYCKEDECVSTEIPSWSTGGNAQITLERSFSIMKNARNNIGANHVELKFQFAGKASMHGVAPDQDFRVSFVFPVTVKGTGFAQIMGMDMGDMELGSS